MLRIGAAALALLLPASQALAQDHSAGTHGPVDAPVQPVLSEPGQGAFAALAEVVERLEADPDTAWGTVTIGALRDHLIDMDRLVTDASAETSEIEGGLSILVWGEGETMETVRRMVPAHAAELAADDRWRVTVTEEPGGVRLGVASDDPAIGAKIRALGFYGLMASQNHHRKHHWAIANGGTH
ncbi:MAG: hypothetical protein ACTS3R_19785 [Inquilinaceae bacterium]